MAFDPLKDELAPVQKSATAEADNHASVHSTLVEDPQPRTDEKTAEVEPTEEVKEQYPHGMRLFLLSAAALMGAFLIFLDQVRASTTPHPEPKPLTKKATQTIVGTAIPKITDEFGGIRDVSWYGAAYFMTYGGFQGSWGKAFKYFDLKRSYMASIVIFEVGSLICGVAPTSKALIVGRVITGIGGAGMSVGCTSILMLSAEPKFRPVLMGYFGVTYGVGSLLGPIIGGAFSEGVTWRWCFYINLPVGGVAAVVIFLFFRLPAAAKPPSVSLEEKLKHLDPVGIALAMGAIVCFTFGLQDAGSARKWSDSQVIGLLVGFVAIVVALAAWETYMGDYAMLLPRFFKRRLIWSIVLYQVFFVGVFILLIFYLPNYFQSIRGATPIESGVDTLPMVVSIGTFAMLGGIFVSKTGHAAVTMFVGAAGATVGCGLLYTLDAETSTGKWVGYQIFTGSSIAFALLNAQNIAQANVDTEDVAAVLSNIILVQTVGGAFSTSAGQAAFVNQLVAKLPYTAPTIDPALVIATGATELRHVFTAEELPGIMLAYMNGIRAIFAVGIGLAGAAFLCTALIPWGKLPSHTETSEEGVPMAV
jgi:MFS family permease